MTGHDVFIIEGIGNVAHLLMGTGFRVMGPDEGGGGLCTGFWVSIGCCSGSVGLAGSFAGVGSATGAGVVSMGAGAAGSGAGAGAGVAGSAGLTGSAGCGCSVATGSAAGVGSAGLGASDCSTG